MLNYLFVSTLICCTVLFKYLIQQTNLPPAPTERRLAARGITHVHQVFVRALGRGSDVHHAQQRQLARMGGEELQPPAAQQRVRLLRRHENQH